MSTISNCFKIRCDEEITKFFPQPSSAVETVRSRLYRIVHYIFTGIWVNESRLYTLARRHPEIQVSHYFKGKQLQRKLMRIEQGRGIIPSTTLEKIAHRIQFIIRFLKSPLTVGAILPSSTKLAREIVSELCKHYTGAPRMILEVGPGTGSFTDKIIKRMASGDQLHLVEFDKKFVDELTKKYGHIPGVTIFHCSILDFPVETKYDYIISGLPLNAFTIDFVENVFTKFSCLAKEDTRLSYFEYIGIPKIKRFLSSPEKQKELDAVLEVKRQFYRAHKLRKKDVFLNVPAARVRHHKL